MAADARKKMLFIVVLALLVVSFWYFDLGQYLTLEYIKSQQAAFAALYAEHGLLLVAGYMLLYILITALSLPGAAVLTLAGGALFGFWVTLLAVSCASSIGATLAWFSSRCVRWA